MRGAGSKFERRGLLVAAVMGAVGVVVIAFFVIRALGTRDADRAEIPAGEPTVLPPPPLLTENVSGLTAGSGMHIQFTDAADPSLVTGELRSASIEPLEARRYLVQEPEMWFYRDDGSAIMVRAARGELYMPTRSQEPESGTLEGDVTVLMFEPLPDGRHVTSDTGHEPALVAKTPALFFDMALGEVSTEHELTVQTDRIAYAGKGVRARVDEVSKRLVVLEVASSEYLTFDPPERSEQAQDDQPTKSPTPTPPQPQTPSTPAPRESAPAPAPPAPIETLYHATFTGDVMLSQQGRSIEADLLEVWARLIDNTLPQGAIAKLQLARAKDAPSHPLSASPPIPASALPLRLKTQDSRLTTAVDVENRPAAPLRQTPDSPCSRTGLLPRMAARRAAPPFALRLSPSSFILHPSSLILSSLPSDDVITLTWSGPLRITPVDAAAPLEHDHVALRFTSDSSEGVRLVDAEREGRATELAYGATTRRVTMVGAPAWVQAPEWGRVEFARAHADLTNGLIYLQDAGSATTADGEIAWSDSADITLWIIDGAVTASVREAVFRGDVHAAGGTSSLQAQTATASFAMQEQGAQASGQLRALEHLHLTGAEQAPAIINLGQDGSLEGRDIDVTLVPGPEGDPDPSVVIAEGNVVGRNEGSVLAAGSLEANVARDEAGELVVTSARAVEGVHFARAEDDIEARAHELRARPAENSVTLLGEDSMVRRGTARVYGDQLAIDTARSSLNVFGPGRFDDGEGSGLVASWTREMLFDDAAGRLECHGDVEASRTVSEGGVYGRDTLTAHRLFVDFIGGTGILPAEGDGAGILPIAGTGDRRLERAIAVGSIQETADGLPAIVQAVRYAHPPAPGDEIQRVPIQAFVLEGARIEATEGGDHLLVPTPGRMLVVDQRPSDAPPQADANTQDARGQALFAWQGDFRFDRTTGEAAMQGDVAVTMREPDIARVTLLDAHRVTATIAEGEQTTLTGATARGAVYLAQRTNDIPSFEIIADALTLDNVTRTGHATAAEGNVVTVFDAQQPTPITARALYFDLEAGRWEVVDPGTLTAPK